MAGIITPDRKRVLSVERAFGPKQRQRCWRSLATERTGCVFITRYGKPWITRSSGSPISAEFRKLADKLNCKRTFYDLRRTFQTIGDNSKDPVAVKAIMGHVDP